jgi:hypothetical protein
MDDSNVTLKVVMVLIVLVLIVHVIGLWPHFLISLTKKDSDPIYSIAGVSLGQCVIYNPCCG